MRSSVEGQKAIYYVTAEIFAAALNSPHLEIFRKKGMEVLLLFYRIDEWMVAGLTGFEGKPLISVAKARSTWAALADADEKAQQEKEAGEQAAGRKVHSWRPQTESPPCA